MPALSEQERETLKLFFSFYCGNFFVEIKLLDETTFYTSELKKKTLAENFDLRDNVLTYVCKDGSGGLVCK